MHPHLARRLRKALPTPAEQAAARAAYLASFAALPAAERELALLENQDAPWSEADRRRYGEILRGGR